MNSYISCILFVCNSLGYYYFTLFLFISKETTIKWLQNGYMFGYKCVKGKIYKLKSEYKNVTFL